MALPRHLSADRMLRLALTCFSTTPKLRECSLKSILSSVVVASQIGLEPGVAGQGYLIPYKGTCTFVPGWQGLVGLLNNSGRATAWTGSVFEGDEWEFELGSRPRCKHTPGPNFGDVDKLIWVYACGKVNGSEQPVVEAWPVSRVRKHRDRYNKVGNAHYSFTNFEMYARKVVLLQVLKYMPRSIELNNALTAADASEAGRTVYAEAGVVIEAESTDIEQQSALPKPSASAPAPVNLAPKPTATPTKPAEATGAGVATPAQAATTPAAAEPVSTTPEPSDAPQGSQEPAPAQGEDTAAAPVTAIDPKDASEALSYVSEFAARDAVTADQVMSYMRDRKLAKPGQTLADMSGPKLIALAKGWSVQDATGKTVCQRIKELAGVA